MSTRLSRRRFLARSIAVAAAAPAVMSVEEHRLLARSPAPGRSRTGADAPLEALDGQNRERIDQPFDLWRQSDQRLRAQSRSDLRVAAPEALLTPKTKVMETWSLCEEHGINTMIAYAGDRHCVSMFQKYREARRKIQFLAQINPDPRDLQRRRDRRRWRPVRWALFSSATPGDLWARDEGRRPHRRGRRPHQGRGISSPASPATSCAPRSVCEAGKRRSRLLREDAPRPELLVEAAARVRISDVIDNYGIDNYWCQEPENVIGFMSRVARPWIAYKVLAAGAIHPRDGFQYAFQNGADFAAVGMFDFQVAEDVLVANKVLTDITTRNRVWRA